MPAATTSLAASGAAKDSKTTTTTTTTGTGTVMTKDILTSPAPSVKPVPREYTEQQMKMIDELRDVSL